MPRSILPTSIIHPPFGGDATHIIDSLKRQPLPNNPSTRVLLRDWSAFCERVSLVQTMLTPETRGQRRRILIIAVAEYTNGSLKVLEGSKTDWKIWAMLATMAGWRVDIIADTVLRPDATRSPTRENIRSFARALLRDNCSGDQFIVAYSGHCDKQGLILADDSQVSPQELHDWFAKPLTTGTQLWTFFDCCESSNLLKLPQTIIFDSNQRGRRLPFKGQLQSRVDEVKGTIISIGSAADKAGELGFGNHDDPHQVRCGSLAFAVYYFFYSSYTAGETLLEAFLPRLVEVLASRPGQVAQFAGSANVQTPVLPMLRALRNP